MKQNDYRYYHRPVTEQKAHLSSFSSAAAPSPYPELPSSGSQLPVPYQAPQVPQVTQPPASGGGGGLGALGSLFGGGSSGGGGADGSSSGSGFNLNQIKGFIDRMGGIDGIVGTMTRVQKMVASFQQMAPMLKLLMGSFGAKAASNALNDDLDGDGLPYRRRKRRRKKSVKTGVKKYRKPGKSWSGKSSKRR